MSREPFVLLSWREAARFSGCSHQSTVKRRLGAPDGRIHWRGGTIVLGWPYERIYSYLSDREFPAPTTLELYGLAELARLLDLTDDKKARELLGPPDAILATSESREFPLWTKENGNAAWKLLNERRLAGDRSFDRKLPFKHRISAKQRERTDRFARGFVPLRIHQPVSRVRFCAPRHVWADPRDIAACLVR
jgi:hypothetical protein